MSRLTRPYYKPIYDLPRPVHPLSPPETDITADSIPVNVGTREASYTDLTSLFHTKVDPPEVHHAPPSEAPSHRIRRSNLSYVHNGSFRNESRSAPRSATRWLIMVLPPPAVSREHSHGLYLNASARSGQTILMPLFPSFSSQLSAIAREFAFPSTSGITIYLQMGDGGLQYAPRVSEESWPILWGSMMDEKQGNTAFGGLPIAGRIEFDLDLKKARWFDMWVTACRKEIDISPPGPSSVALHGREASSSTYEPVEESIADDISVTIQQKVPIIRHVPRKLSLLDRVDVSNLKLTPRQAVLSPAEEATVPASPIARAPQLSDEEREMSIQRVEKKVQNWRASSSFAKSPLVATTGQTALDPANMPNNLPLSDAVTEVSPDGLYPLNLDDFQWSITSAGPSTTSRAFDMDARSDWSRNQSVHLDKRLAGSVCLTPTTCTSFGPPEYEVVSPISRTYRLPSPDIAARCLYSPPLTPATATSWGAPSEWPESPAYSYRAPSIDIAARHLQSRPVTPSTATSWGAPLEWPASPAYSSHAPSVDIAARHLESRPATPSTATSWGAPLDWPDSPLMQSPIPTPGIGGMFFGDDDELMVRVDKRSVQPNGSNVWRHVWPYTRQDKETMIAQTWKQVWPYNAYIMLSNPEFERQTRKIDDCSASQLAYPTIVLYPPVYPYFDLYPEKFTADIERRATQMQLVPKYPIFSIYQATYPSFEIYPGYVIAPQATSKLRSVKLSASYPHIELYAPEYPNLVIYPPILVRSQRPSSAASVYPNLVIYPSVSSRSRQAERHARTTRELAPAQKVIVTKLERSYPALELYPAVYPYNVSSIYPATNALQELDGWQLIEAGMVTKYPCFNIYPAVYPFFDIYPVVYRGDPTLVQKTMLLNSNPVNSKEPITIALKPRYPSIELYPPVYPNLCIYPVKDEAASEGPVSVTCNVKYPNSDLYPAVYPYFDIYRSGFVSTPVVNREQGIALKAAYPNFNLYPPAYPYFDLYSSSVPATAENKASTVTLHAAYPSFDLYPAVYPYFDIYKSGFPSTAEVNATSTIVLKAAYPFFDIYPAVYPYFDVYCSGSPSTPETSAPLLTSLKATYPFFDIYPARYPYFDIYSSGFASTSQSTNAPIVTLKAAYPFFDLYPAAYPYLQLYPSLQAFMQPSARLYRNRKSPRNLIELAYGSAKPSEKPPRRARKTHDELFQLVSTENNSSMRQIRRPRKTHEHLCQVVFAESREDSQHPPHADRKMATPRSASNLSTVPEDHVSFDEALMSDTKLTARSLRSRLDLAPSQDAPPPVIKRSTSLRQSVTAPAQEGAGLPRSRSLRGPRPQAPRGLDQGTDSLVKSKSRRDSIVLEKARHWGSQNGHQPSSSVTSIDESLMSEFPMPPSIPMSHSLPSALSSSPPLVSPQRRVSKLDRSKYPFH